MATTDETLDNNAAKPARIRTLNGDVFQHSLADQIAYDKYKAGKAARAAARAAGRGPLAGLCIARAIPGGSVSPSPAWEDI